MLRSWRIALLFGLFFALPQVGASSPARSAVCLAALQATARAKAQDDAPWTHRTAVVAMHAARRRLHTHGAIAESLVETRAHEFEITFPGAEASQQRQALEMIKTFTRDLAEIRKRSTLDDASDAALAWDEKPVSLITQSIAGHRAIQAGLDLDAERVETLDQLPLSAEGLFRLSAKICAFGVPLGVVPEFAARMHLVAHGQCASIPWAIGSAGVALFFGQMAGRALETPDSGYSKRQRRMRELLQSGSDHPADWLRGSSVDVPWSAVERAVQGRPLERSHLERTRWLDLLPAVLTRIKSKLASADEPVRVRTLELLTWESETADWAYHRLISYQRVRDLPPDSGRTIRIKRGAEEREDELVMATEPSLRR